MPKGIYPRGLRGTSSTQDSQHTQDSQDTCESRQDVHQDAPEGPEGAPLRERVCAYVATLEQRLATLAEQLASIEHQGESTAEREHQLRGQSFALADIAGELRSALAIERQSGKGEPSSILRANVARCHARAERLAESQTRASQTPAAHHYSVLGGHHAAGQACEYTAMADALAALLDGCEPACQDTEHGK